MAALEASMADLEREVAGLRLRGCEVARLRRADFERKVLAVRATVRQLQHDVAQADALVTTAREELGAELRKRWRLSGAAASRPRQLPDWHIDINEETRLFDEAVEEAEEKLQGVSHAMARVHITVQQVRASVDTVKTEVAPLLGRLAAAREARNNSCSALLEMLVAGGFDSVINENDLASVEVLAADGSGWAALPPMATAR
jgi:predicted  nucleic acid-binding Zn-ribbon protein